MSAVTIARTSKVRLVVGLLDNAEELALALADLRARRLQPAQIRVIAQADALDGALARWPAGGDARAFAAWIVCRPAEAPLSWILGPAGSDPDGSDPDARALSDLSHWAPRRHAEQLDRHLRAGGALLLVEPSTDAEEWESCTALLRHASGGIQTHEIARQVVTRGSP